MFKHFVIIDPDPISCFIVERTVSSVFPESSIIIFDDLDKAWKYLDTLVEKTCIIIENKDLDLSSKNLLLIFKELENKNFRLIILSNSFQEKLLSLIPRFFHVKFTYKPLTKKRFKELIQDW